MTKRGRWRRKFIRLYNRLEKHPERLVTNGQRPDFTASCRHINRWTICNGPLFTRDPLKLTIKEINQQMARRGMKGVQKMSAKRALRFKRYLDRIADKIKRDYSDAEQ